MQLIFLGTASCFPTAQRGVSCIALRHDDGNVWLFDCGEGSQIQLQKSSLRPGKITKIFITHMHGDHLFGLPGLICTLSSQCSYKPGFVLEIYGPHGLRQYVRQNLNLSRSPLPFQYVVHEMMPLEDQFPADWNSWQVDHNAVGPLHPQEILGKQIQSTNNVWQLLNKHPTVVAGPVQHRVPSWGFVVKEEITPGKLDIEKLGTLGLKPGPECAKLKQGLSISLPNGTIIHSSDVVGPERPGRKVTILGDTCDSDRMADIALDSDALVHEATLENGMEQNALEKGHSTPLMAATFALKVRAKMLVLTHFSQRYQHTSSVEMGPGVEILGEEARQTIGDNPCCVVVAQDLMEVSVARVDS